MLTCAVELLVAVPLLPRLITWRRRIAAVFVAQCSTHPAVWFILPTLLPNRLVFLWSAETWAVLMEAAIYCLIFPPLSKRSGLLVAACANGASYGVHKLFT